MVLIFTPKTSRRLQYIVDFIFNEVFNEAVKITINTAEFEAFDGLKICYSQQAQPNAFYIGATSLLFEANITPQQIACFSWQNTKAFFKTNCHFGFDVFAASFYLITRYEEYLPHQTNAYGQYQHQQSTAFKNNFLQLPIINIWCQVLAQQLQQQGKYFSYTPNNFTPQFTFDVDNAFAFKHKSITQTIGGFFKNPSMYRLLVLLGLKNDPYNVYNYLHQLHQQHNIKPVYFWLVAQQNLGNDKNILPTKKAMWQLIKKHAKTYNIGLHPSIQSNTNITILLAEKEVLEELAEMPIINSRQHFLQLQWPQTYQNLIMHNFEADYSMGYGTINGFRASVAQPFYWFNLVNDESTNLRVHPFCFMDANAFYEEKLTQTQALESYKTFATICQQVNGQMCSLWHNEFISNYNLFAGWHQVYEQAITFKPLL
jgi:uncharacterized protein YktA (UPF0223 family)